MKQKDVALKQKKIGKLGFESYYSSLFAFRWTSLKASLFEQPLYVRLDFSDAVEPCEPYFIDAASVVAALCLPLSGSKKILDLCAAPGGKSLVLAGCMEENAVLYSNELSPDRKMRLDKVFSSSLSADKRMNIITSCSDGSLWCRRETEVFSSILLDAPCSSERHVLSDEKYLAQWSASRIRSLSSRQWALLSSAFRLLEKNGFLLYATCALSPDENDANISRLLKKFPDAKCVEYDSMHSAFNENLSLVCEKIYLKEGNEAADALLRKSFLAAEKTEFGLHILPDRSGGAGPLYFSLVNKA